MCILCVVQRWSRRVATMLPWLVIPLIALWALSQFLPPGFRFEITSPRLACVVVLLATLFWYEVLMPQLSIWRARRSARLRERRRTEAIELQKLRKTATRRCRNCLTPYRDQNPGGGRFMCSYCGHISKRPVLDLPGPAGSSGIISDLVGKHGWICSQDWPVDGSGNWVSPVQRYWGGGGGGDDRCLTEKSYSGILVFACKLLSCFFLSTRWLWTKVFRVGSSGEDGLSDGDNRGLAGKKGENGGTCQESRGEKARRKAEEKRQARLEREMLEEEERKQREEVARLVDERRKLRDEKLEAEREREKVSAACAERDSRREADRRRKERRKDRDIGSSKSNSDGEELEKRASRENERKRDFDKKSERDLQKAIVENIKSHVSEGVYGNKVAPSKTRYFDRMKGSFLSSSRGGSFFGRNAQSAVPVTKASKPSTGVVDHGQNVGNKRDAHSTGHVVAKSASNGDDKVSETNIHRPMGTDVQPRTTVLKKSWHQLFTRSSAVSPEPDANTADRQNQNGHLETRSTQLSEQTMWPHYSAGNQINFALPLPPTAYPSASGSISHVGAEPMFPLVDDPGKNSLLEDIELFEDPCYVPDPVSLLGPVSESLDNFPLDLGTGFIIENKIESPRVLKKPSPSPEVNKPSPIESPMSKLRISDEKQAASGQGFCTPRSQKLHTSGMDESNSMQEQGTWQMWGSPLAQDGLGLVGAASSWFSPLVQTKTNQELGIHPLPQNPLIPHIAKEVQGLPAIRTSQNACVGNHQNGGSFSLLGPGLKANEIWVQNSPFPQPLPVGGEKHFLPHDIMDNFARNEATFGSPDRSAAKDPFDASSTNNWPKEEWALRGVQEGGSSAPVKPPHIGGLFSTGPDVQSVWSFTHQ